MVPPEHCPGAFAAVPVNRQLGLELQRRDAQSCEVTAAVLAAYSQEHGMVHGALVTAAADTAAVWLFHPDLAPGQAMASVEFKINFLAPATLSGGPLRAAARLVKRGKRLGIAASDVFQGDALVACGLFTYMFFEPSQRA